MRDRLFIFAGLALFVGLFTYPFWHALGAKDAAAAPQVQLPANAEYRLWARDFMRTSHMQLLLDWRDRVVRHQQRDFTAADGQVYRMSLDRAEFCDTCHAYVAVPTPYCWDCHQAAVATEGAR